MNLTGLLSGLVLFSQLVDTADLDDISPGSFVNKNNEEVKTFVKIGDLDYFENLLSNSWSFVDPIWGHSLGPKCSSISALQLETNANFWHELVDMLVSVGKHPRLAICLIHFSFAIGDVQDCQIRKLATMALSNLDAIKVGEDFRALLRDFINDTLNQFPDSKISTF